MTAQVWLQNMSTKHNKAKNQMHAARCWQLLVRREMGAESVSHYGLSNAPLETPWQALERLLPRRRLTAEELAGIISKRNELRRKAKESRARRSQVALE